MSMVHQRSAKELAFAPSGWMPYAILDNALLRRKNLRRGAGTATAIGTINGAFDTFTSTFNDPPKIQQRTDFCTQWMDAEYNPGKCATAHEKMLKDTTTGTGTVNGSSTYTGTCTVNGPKAEDPTKKSRLLQRVDGCCMQSWTMRCV